MIPHLFIFTNKYYIGYLLTRTGSVSNQKVTFVIKMSAFVKQLILLSICTQSVDRGKVPRLLDTTNREALPRYRDAIIDVDKNR